MRGGGGRVPYLVRTRGSVLADPGFCYLCVMIYEGTERLEPMGMWTLSQTRVARQIANFWTSYRRVPRYLSAS
jgi:hypothetical protein